MKESYSEGMADHTGLRSYAGIRKDAGGTLTEVRAGRVLSHEIAQESGCRRSRRKRKAISTAANADAAEESREV